MNLSSSRAEDLWQKYLGFYLAILSWIIWKYM